MGARRQPGGSLAGRPLLEPSCSHAASGKGLFSILVLRDKREAVTCYLLLVTCYWLLVTCYLLRVACCLLRVTCYSLPAGNSAAPNHFFQILGS